MSKIVFTDHALREAAAEYRDAMLAAMPIPEEGMHEPSAEYRSKMAALIKKMERRDARRRWTRSAAAVFLVFILGSGAFLGVNGEARADFLAWLRSSYENSILYRYVGESEAPLPDCELTWLPDGYELTVNDRDENSLTMMYENGNGEGFIFSCDRMTENSLMQIGLTDNYTSTRMKINGYDVELFEDDDGRIALVWMDDGGFIYMINANKLEKTVIMHIFDGIELTD